MKVVQFLKVIRSLELPMERDQPGINLGVTSPSQGYIHDQVSLQKHLHLAELASVLTHPEHLDLTQRRAAEALGLAVREQQVQRTPHARLYLA